MRDFLQRALVMQKPVRMLWWGGYGIGKTHRLNHISHMIETSVEPEYPFQPFTPVCSDIDEKHHSQSSLRIYWFTSRKKL